VPRPAHLVTALPAPLPFSGADDAPFIQSGPTARLLVQRGDTELVVQRLGTPAAPSATIRFPTPWPRRFGGCAVSPAGDVAVFAGRHAVRAVDPAGYVKWELRHRCWGGCTGHLSFEEYEDDRGHRYAGSGSVGFSADGKLVWAHILGPLAQEGADRGSGVEEWLVIDAVDGTVLARTETGTSAAGSEHVAHPDPTQMGLTIGEGQDGAPLRWGRWDGDTLVVDRFDDEDRVLLAVSPTGDHLLTVTHDQDELAVHRVTDGAVVAELNAAAIPRNPEDEPEDDESQPFFDYEGAFIDETTVLVGTVDTTHTDQIARITYPFPTLTLPKPLGKGTWYTTSAPDTTLHIWALGPPDSE
jgi:hypothetical protein